MNYLHVYRNPIQCNPLPEQTAQRKEKNFAVLRGGSLTKKGLSLFLIQSFKENTYVHPAKHA